jgi:hypothetical protein
MAGDKRPASTEKEEIVVEDAPPPEPAAEAPRKRATRKAE